MCVYTQRILDTLTYVHYFPPSGIYPLGLGVGPRQVLIGLGLG